MCILIYLLLDINNCLSSVMFCYWRGTNNSDIRMNIYVTNGSLTVNYTINEQTRFADLFPQIKVHTFWSHFTCRMISALH